MPSTLRSPVEPFRGGAAVTPDDDADLPRKDCALYVGGAGDLSVVTADGSEIIIKNHPAGYVQGLIQRVKATGTTATDILALW
jgi:hypothetical protein